MASRELLIDEDLNHRRIAAELRKRGREATGAAQAGYTGLKDPELFRRIAAERPECVLVTGDDAMPAEHGNVLAELRLTVAVIDPRRAPDFAAAAQQDAWERDVVHRWAHHMAEQERGTVMRYGISRRVWSARKRLVGRQRKEPIS